MVTGGAVTGPSPGVTCAKPKELASVNWEWGMGRGRVLQKPLEEHQKPEEHQRPEKEHTKNPEKPRRRRTPAPPKVVWGIAGF